FDRQIGGGIAAYRRERAIPDAVAADADIGGTKDIDSIAVLARAARAIGDRVDDIVGDDGAVVASGRTPDLDAVVAGAVDDVARDHETACVDAVDGGVDAVGERRAGDVAGDRDGVDGVAPG